MTAVEEEIVEGDPRQVTGLPGVELSLDGFTDPTHGRLGQRGLRAQGVGQGRLHVPDRQPPHEARDDERLEGVGATGPHPEQARGEGLVGAAEFRPLQDDRAGGGLQGHRAVAVARALTAPLAARIALAAQELGDLGVKGALQEQAQPETGHLLEDVTEVLIG